MQQINTSSSSSRSKFNGGNFNSELVSIIICNRNNGHFLVDCIKSVINQTYRPIEIIFIDDASSDFSIEIFNNMIKKIIDKEILIQSFAFQNHFGQIRSINKGTSLARGKYCLILDSDDILYETYIDITKKELDFEIKIDPQIGFVYTNCDLINENGNIISYAISNKFDSVLLESKNYIPQTGLTVTEILKESLPFDENVKTSTNHYKWKKIVKSGWKGKLLQSRLFKYRMHNNNTSGIGKKVLDKEHCSQKNVVSLSELLSVNN
ncbi:MAG: glycosyltransferase [Candidatus Nitrosocosmicus sp.]